MAKSFERQRVIGDVPFTSEGAATRALADTIQSFTNWTLKKHTQQRVISGEEEARQVQPGLEAPELKTKMTAHGQAYNRIVQQGHMAAVKNDYSNNFSQLYNEVNARNGDPQEFYDSAKAYKNKTLNDVSPEQRQAFELDMDASINHYGNNLTKKAMEQAVEVSFNETVKTAGIMIDEGGNSAFEGNLNDVSRTRDFFYVTVIDELVQAGQLKQAEKLKADFDEAIDKQLALGQANVAIQDGRGEEYLRDFMKNPPKDLSRDQIEEYQSSMFTMNNKYNSVQAGESAAQKMEREKIVSDMEIAIYDGNGDFQEVEVLFKTGVIDGNKRTKMYTDINKHYEKQKIEANTLSDVAFSLKNDMPMEYTPANKKGVDLYAKTLNNDQKNLVNLTEKTDILPSQFEETLAIGAKGNAEQMVNAAGAFGGLRDRVPGVLPQFDAVTRERLSSMDYLTKNGVEPENAKEMIEFFQSLPKEELDKKRALYKADNKDLAEELSDMADEDDAFEMAIWSPDIAPMLPAYEEIKFRYSMMTRSNKAGAKLAFEDLKTVYRKSTINSKARKLMELDDTDEIMFMPPEMYYKNINLDDDLRRWAKNNGFKRNELELRSDNQTSKEKSKSWQVWNIIDGNPHDTGKRYKPNMKKAYDDRLKEREEEFKKAKEQYKQPEVDMTGKEVFEPFQTKGGY